MAYPTNKRLHLSPRNMDEAHTTYRCTLTPEGAQGHHFGSNIDSEQVDEHSISSHRLVSHTKATPSVTETSTGSTGWQPPATSKAKGGSHWWPWEWLCELLAIGSLGVMVFTLWYYHDKPQSEWRQSYFTLNGLIAFLATLVKTGLIVPVSAAIGQRKWLRFMPGSAISRRARRLGDFEVFDEASRGSLGSMKLVFSLDAWDLAYLGALITIVSVFFSAITQNVLNTYSSTRDGRISGLDAGRVPRSENFNLTNQPKWTGLNFQQHFWTDITTLAATYNGIMSESIDDVPISCATGNCTWPTIPTLGICGACIDMQDHLEMGCGGVANTDPNTCHYTITGGLNLTRLRSMAEWNDTSPVFAAGEGSGHIFTRKDVVGEGVMYGNISFNFIGQSYSEFVYANRGDISPGNETTFYRGNVLAVECGLWHCLQARSINASNGVVNDTMVDFLNGETNNRDTTGVFRFKDDASFNIHNISSYDIRPDSRSELAMENTLVGALSGSITINANWDVNYSPGAVSSRFTDALQRNGIGSAMDCLHAAWVHADDIPNWWARLAKSLTNNVRTNGYLREDEEERYAGTAWVEVVHIEVRWLWLIFPAVLVALSGMFLTATMIASWQSGLKPWKSFVLPVLYTRLEDGLQDEWKQEYANESSLLREVKSRWVDLDSSDNTWVFRHVEKQSKRTKEFDIAGDTSIDG